MNLRKYVSTIDLKTIIYFAILFAGCSILFLTHNFNLQSYAYFMLISTIVYIMVTHRWYYFQIGISVFILSIGIEFLRETIYQYTWKDPTFAISTLLFGYFFIMFLTTLTNHAEWTVRSPWVATYLGVILAIITELMLLLLGHVINIYILGADGLIVFVLIAGMYLSLGKKIKVNKPERYTDLDFDDLETRLEYKGLKATKTKSGDLIIKDTTDPTKSYRVYLSNEKLIIRDTDKLINNYVLVRNKKLVQAYSWLLRETAKSFEIRGPKPLQSEQFIIINFVDKTSGVQLITIPVPRTKREHTLAMITVNKNDTRKLNKLIEQATVMLNVEK